MHNLKFTFDLKGSKHGRIEKGIIKPTTVQKDLNLMRNPGVINLHKHWLFMRRTIGRDAAFLRSIGVIDYSLLVAGEETNCYSNEYDEIQESRTELKS